MCGRYALVLRPSQIRRMLQDEDMEVDDAPEDEGDQAPRRTHNFAPGYHGIVYRADVPDHGAGPARHHGAQSQVEGQEPKSDSLAASKSSQQEYHYKLQSMKWGLIPFWTKRNPDYGSMLKTINCRDDSLAAPGGLWASMKGRKRCIVVAQGFYEWLKPAGSREKIPHYIKRKDGKLMCFAGLWDCVQYEDDDDGSRKSYTYTIITTDSNAQLKFLHDRMPVILDPGSSELRTWLDPSRYEWNAELQGLLRPYTSELEVYPVSKEVGKVGNDSPNFIVPVASKENKSNIANFFANAKSVPKTEKKVMKAEVEVEKMDKLSAKKIVKTESVDEVAAHADDGGMSDPPTAVGGVKREASDSPNKDMPPTKKILKAPPASSPSQKKPPERQKISATSNQAKSPVKKKDQAAGSQKITKFFGNSA